MTFESSPKSPLQGSYNVEAERVLLPSRIPNLTWRLNGHIECVMCVHDFDKIDAPCAELTHITCIWQCLLEKKHDTSDCVCVCALISGF